MRLALIALAAAAIAAPALAQPQPHRDDDHNRPGPSAPGPQARHNDPAPPSHWGKRGKDSWSRHIRACEARYKSYNPRTDRYVVRRGVTALCRL